MNDLPEPPTRRRRAPRKTARPEAAAAAVNEPAVQAILDQALHSEPLPAEAAVEMSAAARPADKPAKPRRAPRKRARSTIPPVDAVAETIEAIEAMETTAAVDAAHAPSQQTGSGGDDVPHAPPTHDHGEHDHGEQDHGEHDHSDSAGGSSHDGHQHDQHAHDGHARDAGGPPGAGGPAATTAHGAGHHPAGHHWVYLAMAMFLLSLGFGLWGVWVTFFADRDAGGQSARALRASSDKLSQDISTLRRSDQISRDANRDLERTLADRDEEIAGLRADVAFYESFVGATGQRRGLSVHDLDMRLQGGEVWHFVATLTQNLNRGAVNGGRVTLSVEGTRNDRMERLAWSSLRKQNNAPGVGYSFKYFQQVEGEVILPKDFKPLRVSVRLVPTGGSAVEQSFPWPETVRAGEGG